MCLSWDLLFECFLLAEGFDGAILLLLPWRPILNIKLVQALWATSLLDIILNFFSDTIQLSENVFLLIMNRLLNLGYIIINIILYLIFISLDLWVVSFFFSGLSLGIWSLIIGIPLFFLLSFTIIMGDSWFAKGEEETAVLRPIRKRI